MCDEAGGQSAGGDEVLWVSSRGEADSITTCGAILRRDTSSKRPGDTFTTASASMEAHQHVQWLFHYEIGVTDGLSSIVDGLRPVCWQLGGVQRSHSPISNAVESAAIAKECIGTVGSSSINDKV